MSRYAVKYRSASKGTEEDIEAMHTNHLLNAWRELFRQESELNEAASAVLSALCDELESRGFEYDGSDYKPKDERGETRVRDGGV